MSRRGRGRAKGAPQGARAPRASATPAGPGWEERLEGGKREPWVRCAYAIGALTAALFVYLGLKPGGLGPIYAYLYGKGILFAAAAITLLAGMAISAIRRPVLQRGRLAAFGCLGAAVWLSGILPLPYPSSHEDHPSAVRFRLPFRAPPADPPGLAWTVRWGGRAGPENALVLQPDRRFGFVFVVCDAEGRSRGPGGFHCLGADVVAPAEGDVVAVHDGEPDGRLDAVGTRAGIPPGEEPLGNHVVLRVAGDEYLFLAGLAAGSLRVQVGEHVLPGAPIGRVGYSLRSALTPEPALAVHLQDTPEPRRGEGVPFRFRDYVSGVETVDKGLPIGGFSRGRHIGERVRPRED